MYLMGISSKEPPLVGMSKAKATPFDFAKEMKIDIQSDDEEEAFEENRENVKRLRNNPRAVSGK